MADTAAHLGDRVEQRVARGLARLLERSGPGSGSDPDEADLLGSEEPWLAALYSAAVRGRVATGPRTGQRVLRFGDRIDADALLGIAENSTRSANAAVNASRARILTSMANGGERLIVRFVF